MIIIDIVVICAIMHADGSANGCVDTVLTGWRGHIPPLSQVGAVVMQSLHLDSITVMHALWVSLPLLFTI